MAKRKNENRKFPELRGFVDEDKNPTINVWCPYCKKFHIHGWPKGSNARTGSHRIAHCHNLDSPFTQGGGYYVKPFTKKDLIDMGIKKLMKRNNRKE